MFLKKVNMSKLISRTLAAFSLAGLLIVPLANAATTGSVTLGGSVSSTLSIVSTPTSGVGGASDLNLTAGTNRIVKVADLAITTNNEQGFSLSAIAVDLTNGSSGTITLEVKTVGNGATAPVAAAFSSGTDLSFTTSIATASAGADDGDLYIMYSPAATQDPGIYAGSIGLSVSDN
jgi:hypothetical protein